MFELLYGLKGLSTPLPTAIAFDKAASVQSYKFYVSGYRQSHHQMQRIGVNYSKHLKYTFRSVYACFCDNFNIIIV